MALYIKANRLVAEHLNLQNERLLLSDGNYMLWQGDMLAFGPLTLLQDTLRAIGAIALMPHEARQEQDGTVTRPLPQATDPRFITPVAVAAGVDSTAEEGDTPASGEGGVTDSVHGSDNYQDNHNHKDIPQQ